MTQATLALIKPDATERNIVGKILSRAEDQDLSIVAMKLLKLSMEEAEGFYYVHRDKSFFESLTSFMSEGSIVAIVFRGGDAIEKWRQIMGGTDPARAEDGTIRAVFGETVERNSTHGSDSLESARFEIGYFFPGLNLVK